MVIGAILVICVLMFANKSVDTAADTQRVKDKYAGVDEQPVTHAMQKADGCASGCTWVFLVVVMVALVGALMVGGISG